MAWHRLPHRSQRRKLTFEDQKDEGNSQSFSLNSRKREAWNPTQGRDGSPSGPKSQARSAVSGTGAATPRNWDACGEASLPNPFEGRCRADLAYGAPRRFKHGADNQAAGRW